METKITRPPLESLACVEADCELYGQRQVGLISTLVWVDVRAGKSRNLGQQKGSDGHQEYKAVPKN